MAMEPAIREADGVKIRFAEAGHGGTETVVMTSPWPESLFAFRKLWDRLAEQFHVVAIDLPGFGQSERQLDLLSPRAMGAFLVQMLREWDLGPVHFVAPDVGTSAALWAAANDPEHVRSMAIGGGAMAVPLQVGGSLKDIIDAPDMEGYRKIDSKDILGPVYDAMPEGAPPSRHPTRLFGILRRRPVRGVSSLRPHIPGRAAKAGRKVARHRDTGPNRLWT